MPHKGIARWSAPRARFGISAMLSAFGRELILSHVVAACAYAPALADAQEATPRFISWSELSKHGTNQRWALLNAARKPVEHLHRAFYINGLVNGLIQYRTDLEARSVLDHWDAPAETLERGVGDCEDFAITKYALLLASGIPAQKLRLGFGYLRHPVSSGPHMVLIYGDREDTNPFVLDEFNQNELQLSQRPDFELLATLDVIESESRNIAMSSSRMGVLLGKWRELIARSPELRQSISSSYSHNRVLPYDMAPGAGLTTRKQRVRGAK